MKVILLKDIPRIGKKYEIKEIADGHAFNYLIPRKLAEPATASRIREIESRRTKAEATRAQGEEALSGALAGLAGVPVELSAKANEQGHLFKAVKSEDIVEALASRGVIISPEQIDLPEPIKETGAREILVAVGEQKIPVAIEIRAIK